MLKRTLKINVHCNLFSAECIDIEALRYITVYQISQLLRLYPLGIRIKFGYCIKEWQINSKGEKNSIDGVLSSTSTVASSSTSLPPVPSEPMFSLDEVLIKSSQGALITNYYKCNNSLNEGYRNLLVDLIIASLLENKCPMSVALANNIADAIVSTFTTEIKVNIKIVLYIYISFNVGI